MSSSALLDKLIDSLQIMPGIGPVSATRIAYYLLDLKREEGLRLSQSLKDALEHVAMCPYCRNYTDAEGQSCVLCENKHRRSLGLLCVVETPQDVDALENSGSFKGSYFVLHGHLSPLDGIGPAELGLGILDSRLQSGEVKEVILALSQSVEGSVTAQYIAAMARKYNLKVSTIATGVPIGGDIRTTDGFTLANSIENRRDFS